MNQISSGQSLIPSTIASSTSISKDELLKNILQEKIICISGRPASGKGTLISQISTASDLEVVSTSGIIKEYLKNQQNQDASNAMKKGNYVNDDLVISLVKEKLESLDPKRGCILDGFPRTIAQASWLTQFCQSKGLDTPKLIIIDVPDELCKERMKKRVATSTEIREDDIEQIFETRLSEYSQNAEIIFNEFNQHRSVITIDGTGSIEESWNLAQNAILEHFCDNSFTAS